MKSPVLLSLVPGSSVPTRRLTPRFPKTVRATALLAVLASAACAASQPGDEPEAAQTAETTTEASTAALGEQRNRPAPSPEYSLADLQALSESAEVQNLNLPFASAPAPDESVYVTMSDGTRLAVSLYFPAGFDAAVSKLPVALIETWYGRAVEATGTAIDLYRGGGIAVAIVDPRGFGASFGHQTAFLNSEVRRDQREIIAWLASRSWSNGKVAAVGWSISGSDAEIMAASGASNLQAAILRAVDFDHYTNNIFPGGIPNSHGIDFVEFLTGWMRGEACVQDLAACAMSGIAPVDGDADFHLLQSAFRDHALNIRGEVLRSLVYRDDALGTGTVGGMSTLGVVDELRRTAVPARVSASWLDGTTAESALVRFNELPNVAMEVSIGATTHSGGLDADPFSRKPFGAARPGTAQQYAADVGFVRRVFAGEAVGRTVHYYVLGSNVWKTTAVWPPAGVSTKTFQLSRTDLVDNATPHANPPAIRAGERSYQVDPTTSSGAPFNRWASQGGAPIYYGDRRFASGRRLSFDAAPVERDTEIVGAPELCLAFRTDQPDGTVFAYLEDVAPDGRVTHLTEGELRLLHRKTAAANRGSGCDPAPGTDRSFKRADGAAVTPGALMHVEVPLLPTAALIHKGHRLRLSLTGADAGTFPLVTDAPGTWLISYGGKNGSTLEVPVRAWSPR